MKLAQRPETARGTSRHRCYQSPFGFKDISAEKYVVVSVGAGRSFDEIKDGGSTAVGEMSGITVGDTVAL
jgi:hypothetical protein